MDDDTFPPLRRIDGYLPIADHGLIGDGVTAALVARDGTIDWLCVPRFDAPPLFCAILDRRRGGHFTVQPEGLRGGRQRYLGDSGVLVTELRGDDGTVEITDALTLQRGADLSEGVACDRKELVRAARVTSGRVRLKVTVAPRGGASVERHSGGLRLRCAGDIDADLHLHATRPLEGLDDVVDLEAGEQVDLTLSWAGASRRFDPIEPRKEIEQTVAAWDRWMSCVHYDGPQAPLVRRSATTLKLLDHHPNGAVLAAPTSSLPEWIGGRRNWDYRYAWIRDAAFSVYALRRIGMEAEARGFLGWVLDAVEGQQRPRVLYDIDAGQPLPEREDPELEGYRGSGPVRWGNGAADQQQHDVFGEIIDCAYQWVRAGADLDEHLWSRLRAFVDLASHEWDQPDHGIWEVRTPGRVFTYSAALCHVALDRGAKLAGKCGLDGDVEGWSRTADRIREEILDAAWDDERQALTEALGGGGLDASALSLPLRRVLSFDHPRMIATVERVRQELGVGDGLLLRYLPDESPDGVDGDEGAFLLCSFWLVDNLAGQGRLDEASDLYESLCARANPLGLLPEQIHPSDGGFLGNFPQAFSHVGVISSGTNLHRRLGAAS